MVRIWICSDTHFGHENMVREFTLADGSPARVHPERGDRWYGAEECDQYMIAAWNDAIQESDHVYHLGDVAMRKGFLSVVPHLKGHKRLVRGNHDIFKTKDYLEAGFKEIYGSRVLANCLLTHIPVHPESLGRFLGCVHGHTHGRVVQRSPESMLYLSDSTVADILADRPDPRYRNVCVEQTAYRPVLLEQVVAELEAA